MRKRWLLALAVSMLLGSLRADELARKPLTPQEIDFVEKRVRPLLIESCHGCHGAKKQMAGLRLDSRAAVLRGGDSGPAIVPGDPDSSRLLRAVRHSGALKMPP